MISRRILLIVLSIAWLFQASEAFALDYADARSKAVRACEAIDPSQSQSGLIFNPDGYRSYYVRSKCFQDAAIEFRDRTLCDQVRERRSLLSSSWGYSAARCRQLVAQGTATDRASLEATKTAYVAGGITLRDFRVERNGNGRDFDIIPAFAGTYAHGYTLTFEILANTTSPPAVLHSSGYHLDQTSNLRIYVRQADVTKQLPLFSLNRPYSVRATVTLDVGFGGPSGYWSPAFINSVFPAAARSRSLAKTVTF
jgi:hypothetical protein